MLLRIDDALRVRPPFVIILGGINDLANSEVPLAARVVIRAFSVEN
jgi:hypothetical protein